MKVSRGLTKWGDGTAAGAAFLIGAGCSRSAGIPLASDIARSIVQELAQVLGADDDHRATPEDALEWLQFREAISQGCDFGDAYNEIFERHYKSDRKQREILRKIIAGANGRMNWAHVCLGELVAQHYVQTVLTTNFDQLVVRGINFTGVLPMIADGIESMDRLEQFPMYPQVVHLHGSLHSYRLRNSNTAVIETSSIPSMQGTIWNICRGADLLVVVGYAGREEGVVKLLANMASLLPSLIVYWVTYEPDESGLSDDVLKILSLPNKYVIHGQDADAFFAELMEHLSEPIRWMDSPLDSLAERRVLLSEPGQWMAENTRNSIQTALDLFGRKLDAMGQTSGLPEVDEKVGRAAAASLSGNDEKVISLLVDLPPDGDSRIAPLLALSLIRVGDASQDRAKLERAIQLLVDHRSADPGDFSAEILLGDGYNALADLLDSDETAAEHREQATEAFAAAMKKVPDSNLRTWRAVREKYATAVLESGKQGGEPDDLNAAVTALEELLDHPADFGMSRVERGVILDRLAMLLLVRGQRKENREDLLDAVEKSRQAREAVLDRLSTTFAIVILRDHASAYRALGGNSIASGRAGEGREHLRRAAELYREAGTCYLSGVTDADQNEAKDAAREAFDESQKVFTEMGLVDQAAEVQNLILSLS